MATAQQPTTPKRTKPTPSPEFAQARLRRDIRILDERRAKLIATHDEKMATIKEERKKLTDDLAAVDAALAKGTGQ